jgi:hypothetical protein
MPHFYFHVLNDIDARDEVGSELPDIEAAIAHATQAAREMMAEVLQTEGRLSLDHRIEIENGDHRVVDTVLFRDVVKIEG